MAALNGAELLAALPIYAGHDTPDHCVVAVRVRAGEYVTAWVATLADPTWSNGHYFADPAGAVADAYLRANIFGVGRGHRPGASRQGSAMNTSVDGGHDPECIECEHDCPWRRHHFGAPFCAVCDDHYEAAGVEEEEE
jgi:hypothetical protein